MATILGAAFIYTPQDFASAGANLVATALSVANLKFMLQGNYFEISPDAQPFLHYWSLSIEEQFYFVFPLFLLLLFRYARRHLALVVGVLGALSLIGCVLLTIQNPVWAFYLLPTRAWELFAGCLLAIFSSSKPEKHQSRYPWLQPVGLAVVLLSFFLINAGSQFPGWQAIFPVAGTIALLCPVNAPSNFVERWLSAPVLVRIGRMSYSLYLWHWPIFSLIDYRLYLAPEPVRLALKIGLSFLAAWLSFRFIENPSRSFLNQRKSRAITFASLAIVLAICIPIGIWIRRANYVNATFADVANGGLVFPGKPDAPSVILMGDSNGSMYGKVIKEICADLDYKLTVISVAAGDTLPNPEGESSQLWKDSLAVVKKEKPDYLVIANLWTTKLEGKEQRLTAAISSLSPFVGKIILLNQPPKLPLNASRAAIRAGASLPFLEEIESFRKRKSLNSRLQTLAGSEVVIVDIAERFENPNAEALFLNENDRQLYHDATHLSGFGADRIRPLIEAKLLPSN